MCGRSRCTLAPERVLQVAGASRWVDRERYQPSHNLAPGGWSPVVVAAAAAAAAAPAGGAAAAAAPEHEVRTMRWGLVPSYTKPSDKPDPWRLFNARSETAAETPAFRRLVPSRRCLVLLDGFYEWNKERAVGGGSGKQPYYVHLEGGGPMVAAGLYDVWAGPDGPLPTYTILTCDAAPRLEWLHDRMPVLLHDEEAQRVWLSAADKGAPLAKVLGVLRPYNGEDLAWHPVTKAMSSASYQVPDASAPLKVPEAKAFFQPRAPRGGGGGAPGAAAGREARQAPPPETAAHGRGDGGAAAPAAAAADAPAPAAATPGHAHKRPASPLPSPGSSKKKARPPGQRDIAQFFSPAKTS